jgi:hypothetical protein
MSRQSSNLDQMPVDTRGFQEKHVGKRLRIELNDGQIEEIDLLELTVCEKPEPCCGITYRLIRANVIETNPINKSNEAEEPKDVKVEGSVYWTGFGSIRSFEILGDVSA